MRKEFIKKIISGTLIISIALSFFSFAPRQAKALFGVGDIVTDPGNEVQNTITAGSSGVSAGATYSLNYKEFVLDPIAYTIAKQILRNVTTSVVNWINSGFNGSPSFVTDPTSFFANVAGDIIGGFVAKNSDLNFLCSPFSIDVRLALALKYRPYQKNRYACTLGDIIKNAKNAAEGASINGFTAGDFSQGRWPAFVSMTTEPQNNVYGAYIQANTELSLRISNATLQQKDQLDQGRGFLSWQKCTTPPTSQYAGSVINSNTGGTEYIDDTEVAAEQTRATQAPQKKCETQTPGSVIAGVLDKQLGVPSDQLNLANEFNEIVNALFAQLVNQVLVGGLHAVSGSGSSDVNSYVNQIQNEQASSNQQLDSIRLQLISSIDKAMTDIGDYKNVYKQAYQKILDVKNTLESAKACYTTKLAADRHPPLSSADIAYAQSKLKDIDDYAIAKVNQPLDDFLKLSMNSDRIGAILTSIKTRANAAKTIGEFTIPAQEFTALVQTQQLPTPQDKLKATQKLNEATTLAGELQPAANDFLGQCQVFPLFK